MLTNLEDLRLAHNKLTGTIPTVYPETIISLDYAGNALSGGIPTELCSFRSLRSLRFDDNTGLGGNIAPIFRCGSGLKSLSAVSCGLTGSIPTDMAINNMEVLQLTDNTIGGTLPTMFGEFRSLRSVQLMSNRLSGTIPSEFGVMDDLVTLRLDNNFLSGTLPRQLGQFSALRVFSASDNRLEGAVPAALCRSVGNLTQEEVGCELECGCCTDPGNVCFAALSLGEIRNGAYRGGGERRTRDRDGSRRHLRANQDGVTVQAEKDGENGNGNGRASLRGSQET